jgi:hypothetical protein
MVNFAGLNALRIKLGASDKAQFAKLVKLAEDQGLLPRSGWENERLDAGRELRNRVVHTGQQQLWTPAMTRNVIASSHEAVAALFPQ